MDWRHGLEVRKGKLICEKGHTKWYTTSDPQQIIIRFKDEIQAKRGNSPVKVRNKALHDGDIASVLFSYLESYHIPTHFIDLNKGGEILVKNSDPIPIEVWVWNIAHNGLSKRVGLKKGTPLNCSIVEYYLNDEEKKHPMVNFDHICALDLSTAEELQRIDQLSRKANTVLKSFFNRRALELILLVLEFSRIDDQIVLAGEISPNRFTVWDVGDPSVRPEGISQEDAGAYERLKERICK